MLLASFVGLVIVIAYMVVNSKSRLTYVVSTYIFSIVMMMIVAVLYTTKISTYGFSTELDYAIYLFFTNNIRLTLGMVSRLLNFSFAVFLFATVFYVKVISKKSLYEALIFLVPVVLFVIVNDPVITKNLYLSANGFNENTALIYENIQVCIEKFNSFIFVAYALIPLYYIIRGFFEMKLSREKRDLLLSAVIVLLIYICVYFIFVCGPYKFITMNNVNFMKIPVNVPADISNAYIPFIILLVLIAIFSIILYYKPFASYLLLNKLEFANNSKWLDKNVNMILHLYKNAFWGINQYIKFAEDNIEDTEKVKKNLAKGRSIAETHIEMLINMQSKLDNVRDKNSYFKLDDCITYALNKTGLPTENVNVVFENYDKDIVVFGDYEHMSEVFVNLFLNSIQATDKSKKDNLRITLSAETDKSYILINVTDNGCGIAEEDIKEVFKPFFSKKTRNKSGGIGLYYVDNVIRHHYGEISVKSKVNEYTTFRIVLPAGIK